MKEAKAKEMFLNREICLVNDQSEKLKGLLKKWVGSGKVFKLRFIFKLRFHNMCTDGDSTSIPSIFVDDIEIEENILEAGKWYHADSVIVYYKGNNRCFYFEKEDHCWYEDYIHSIEEHIEDNYEPISESDVLPYLTKITKERGYKEGVYVEEFYLEPLFPIQSEVYMLDRNVLLMGGVCIMYNGKWLKIIN